MSPRLLEKGTGDRGSLYRWLVSDRRFRQDRRRWLLLHYRSFKGYHHLGRRKHLTQEIEIVINHHEKVLEACVVGIPDERWGEKVAAAVIPKPGAILTEKEMKDHCKTHLLGLEMPKRSLVSEKSFQKQDGKGSEGGSHKALYHCSKGASELSSMFLGH